MSTIAHSVVAIAALVLAVVALMLLQVVREDTWAIAAKALEDQRRLEWLESRTKRLIGLVTDDLEKRRRAENPQLSAAFDSINESTERFAKSLKYLSAPAPKEPARLPTLWSKASRRLSVLLRY